MTKKPHEPVYSMEPKKPKGLKNETLFVHWPPVKVKYTSDIKTPGLYEIHDRKCLSLIVWDGELGSKREDGWVALSTFPNEEEKKKFCIQWIERDLKMKIVEGEGIGIRS